MALKELNEIKADIVKIDIEGFEDKVLFPYLSSLEKNYLPSLIIIEDNSADWDLNILNWLEKNHYKRVGETRGNIFLVKKIKNKKLLNKLKKFKLFSFLIFF